jgi:tetratricopeptide (TPR) repeat protein
MEAVAGQLLATVDPGWSHFARMQPPEPLVALVREARALMPGDPGRVAEILAQTEAADGVADPLLEGLRADALYFVGGDRLFEAQRLYRSVVTARSLPEADGWCHFMIGSIHKGMGFWKEAEVEFRAALEAGRGPWTPALAFNLGVLYLETSRFAEAQRQLSAWVDSHRREPGRALVLFLLGEATAALGDAQGAAERFREALAEDPQAWTVRPEIGFAMADLFDRAGEAERAVAFLDAVVERYPGTEEAGLARLKAGGIWEALGRVTPAAMAYGRILDERSASLEGREAVLRLALLGVDHAQQVELVEPLPAFRYFYRPRPTLEEFVAGREPLAAQRALQGLAVLERREGRPGAALAILARAFEEYPESPESGRAYERFMDLLEEHLAELAAAERHAESVLLYEGFRSSIGWAPTRDTGGLVAAVAGSYEELGAPALAREKYEELLETGTRGLELEALRRRLLATRVAEGDLEALREWTDQNPSDWRALLNLAAEFAASGRGAEARRMYLAASRSAPGAAEKLTVLSQADREAVRDAGAEDILRSLEVRAPLWDAMEGDGWREHSLLVRARLQFALEAHGEAVRLYRQLQDLSAEDAYLLAIAEQKTGNGEESRARLQDLAAVANPLIASLARLQLEIGEIGKRASGTP